MAAPHAQLAAMGNEPNPLFYLLATFAGYNVLRGLLSNAAQSISSQAVGLILLYPIFRVGKARTTIIYFVYGFYLAVLASLWRFFDAYPGVDRLVLIITILLLVGSTRHVYLQTQRSRHPLSLETLAERKTDAMAKLTNPYFVFVLGSGGHTKEMLAMMEAGFGSFSNLHRRYILTSGDAMSLKHLESFENDVKEKFDDDKAGTFDKHIVTRARKVHQSILTTPFTSFWSICQIVPLLLSKPKNAPKGTPDYPNVVVTNGPATGFFVGLVAHLLKVFMMVPDDSMQVVYIESWARIKTLSLTGKLFYETDIADLFLVQHQDVADKYKVPNAGYLVVGRPDEKED